MNTDKFEILSVELINNSLELKIKNAELLKKPEIKEIKEEYSFLFPDVENIFIIDGNTNKKYIEKNSEALNAIEYNKQKRINLMEKQRQENKKNRKTKTKKIVNDDTIILGAKIKDDIKKIAAIEDENMSVCYEGIVYSYDMKITRNGYMLVSFSLVDSGDGISVKYFMNEKQQVNYRELKNGLRVKVKGVVSFDTYVKENTLTAKSINLSDNIETRRDVAKYTRSEFKIHTNMSQMSGLCGIEEIIKRAVTWKYKGILVCDEGAVQSYPDAMAQLKQKWMPEDFKIAYSVNAKIIDSELPFVKNVSGLSFDTEYVVFDIETTGLSYIADEIIEIGAFKMKGNRIVDTFVSLIKPRQSISLKTIDLTGINDNMVSDADPIEIVLPKFKEFCSEAILVAHNSNFDTSFIYAAGGKLGISFDNPVLDTLALSRMFVTDIKRHSLDKVSRRLGVELTRHHRAEADVDATCGILIKLIEIMKDKGISGFDDLNHYAGENILLSSFETYPMTLIIKDPDCLPKFYELISNSHLNRYFKEPLYDLSEIRNIRDSLLIGAAGSEGDLFRAYYYSKSDDELKKIILKYDYIEVYPTKAVFANVGINEVNKYRYMQNNYRDYVIKICSLADEIGIPVVAVSNAYYLDPEDKAKRTILLHSDQEYKRSKRRSSDVHLRTTDELLDEFSYLGRDKAKEIVIENPNKILDSIPQLQPIPSGTFPPFIEGSEEDLRKMCYAKAHSMYGDELPEIVAKRLDRELKSIIGNGYAVMYIIANKIVGKSNEDGFLVGSRGSVGSSFAATTADITEVNPLPPHYYCLEKPCHYVEFVDDTVHYNGFDLPDKNCPICGNKLNRDGHNIPFETFMGFTGEKEPDIDLNFASTYLTQAHDYTGLLFGNDHVFRAGTISTIQGKTAFGYVKKFFEDEDRNINSHYANYFSSKLEGVKRTTGQHAGGLMVVPSDKSIYDFTPIQFPSNDGDKGTITTHFDYGTLSGKILKLDLLGHNSPTTIKILEEYTGFSAFDIPFDDADTMDIFNCTKSLQILDKSYDEASGALGIPEFGTIFVRGILEDTKPTTFFELAKICGVAHGTNVWNNNAQDLIRSGTCTLLESICVRDEIMTHLIKNGLESSDAFNITEKVRKGKGLTEEHEALMRENKIPEWYIESCKKISYMFPLAHSVAYVMMSFRIAYYKVHFPLAFYAAFFSANLENFDAEIISKGRDGIVEKIKELQSFANTKEKSKEQGLFYVLELAKEMLARGYSFKVCDILKSDAEVFSISDNSLLMPLRVVPGLGIKAAQNIVEYRNNNEIYSVDDIRKVVGVSKTSIENFRIIGALDSFPESSQFTLDMFM